MKSFWSGLKKGAQPLVVRPAALTVLICAALGLALALSGCVNVAGYTQPTLVRLIDASYAAPAVDVTVENSLIAGNVGLGTITPYGTLPASGGAYIKVTAATGGATLVSTDANLLAGHQFSILLTDNGAASNGYNVTVLQDQQIQAAGNHSAFRFLNQALAAGAVDIYMVPPNTKLKNALPIAADVAAGTYTDYISFASQTVTMVITPTGVLTPKYTSTPITLTGGEVRTVLITDTQLTSNPPVQVSVGDDAGPSD